MTLTYEISNGTFVPMSALCTSDITYGPLTLFYMGERG